MTQRNSLIVLGAAAAGVYLLTRRAGASMPSTIVTSDVELQAVADTVPVGARRRLTFPAGEYEFKQGFIQNQNAYLYIDVSEAVILPAPGVTAFTFRNGRGTGALGSVLHSPYIFGTEGEGQTGILIENSDRVLVDGGWRIEDCDTGIHLLNTTHWTEQNWIEYGFIVRPITGIKMESRTTTWRSMGENTFRSIGIVDPRIGLEIGQWVSAYRCTFDDFTMWLHTPPSISQTSRGVFLDGRIPRSYSRLNFEHTGTGERVVGYEVGPNYQGPGGDPNFFHETLLNFTGPFSPRVIVQPDFEWSFVGS